MSISQDLVELRPGRALNILHLKNPHSKKTLFFCHGLGGRLGQWQAEIECLKNNYNILAFDLLGHGESAKPQLNLNTTYSFLEFVADLQALLQRYVTAENYIIGHSYGGALSTYLALQNPTIINKLILINPLLLKPDRSYKTLQLLPVWLLKIIQFFLTKNFAKIAFASSADPALVAQEVAYANKNLLPIIKAMINGIQFIPEENLTQLKQPTLLLLSPQDNLLSAAAAQKFYKKIPQIEIQFLPNTGHLAIMENPETINQSIRDFIG